MMLGCKRLIEPALRPLAESMSDSMLMECGARLTVLEELDTHLWEELNAAVRIRADMQRDQLHLEASRVEST
jgi:hypothetical protein